MNHAHGNPDRNSRRQAIPGGEASPVAALGRDGRLWGRGWLLGVSGMLLVGAWIAVTDAVRPASIGSVIVARPAEAVDDELLAVAPPPFSPGVFPCSECHFEDEEVDMTRRPLEWHEEIVFEHDAENRWCFSCHNPQQRDLLRLADGRLIRFEESYQLCGQCHGPQLRHWRAGDHGKRTGMWLGPKEYLLCAHCHDPHSPHIKPMQPMPPPIRQENLR
jgi:hypothetical protein